MSVQNVSLGDIAAFIRGVTYKPTDLVENFSADSLVCMRTANIQAQLDQSDLKSIPSHLVKAAEKRLIAGDILVSTANSWNLVGKCCWVPELAYDAVPGGFIAALRADPEKVVPRYLYHWFNSPKTQIQARNCGRQTTNISNMDLNRCSTLTLPLPTLQEQRRIATILDKADALRAKRRKAIAKLDQLLQSVFVDMFGDPVTNPKGWPKASIGSLCEIGSGSTPSRKEKAHFQGSIPWVKSTEVDWGFIESTSENISENGKKAARLKTFPINTVVVALYGQGVTRGKCAILEVPATMNQACAGIKPSEKLHHIYLFQCLKLSYENLRAQARGGNQGNLNIGILSDYLVPIPPVKKQLEFAALFTKMAELATSHESARQQTDVLFASLQLLFFKAESIA